MIIPVVNQTQIDATSKPQPSSIFTSPSARILFCHVIASHDCHFIAEGYSIRTVFRELIRATSSFAYPLMPLSSVCRTPNPHRLGYDADEFFDDSSKMLIERPAAGSRIQRHKILDGRLSLYQRYSEIRPCSSVQPKLDL